MNEVYYTAKFVFRRIVTKAMYWSIILFPVIAIMAVTVVLPLKSSISFNDVPLFLEIVLCAYVLMTGFCFSMIVTREFFNDKTSRVMETLITMSNAKIQFYGKLLGITATIFLANILYVGLFIWLEKSASWMGNMLRSIVKQISAEQVIIFSIAAVIIVVQILLIAIFLGVLIDREEKIGQASFFTLLYSGICVAIALTTVLLISNLSSLELALPILGPILLPILIVKEAINPIVAVIAIAWQFIIVYSFFTYLMSFYRKNVLNYAKRKLW
ncbi:MAG: hypothetical protein ABF575_02350 [Liquorilactobacillus hordei]|uniref:hypothetical protein n=1 Tax=Liquorilactobacillus hordei TaxID=468911 RepID=UPI0039E8CB80